MSNKYDHTSFCDHCGEPTTDSVVIYSRLPFDVNSALKGESGILCMSCDIALLKEKANK
jgi:hypothetical protein